MAKRTRDLVFPIGGLNRRLGFQAQPPFTYPDGNNVRGTETFEKRGRGGSRPCLVKAFPTQVSGASNPIRMLAMLRSTNAEGTASFEDLFSTNYADLVDSDANWHLATWTGVTDSPATSGGFAVGSDTVDDYEAAVLIAQSPAPSNDETQSVSALASALGNGDQRLVHLYMFLNDGSPDITSNGIEAMFKIASNGFPNAAVYVDGVLKAQTGIQPAPADNTIKVEVTSNDIILVYWGAGTSPVIKYNNSGYSRSGKRVGFGLTTTTISSPPKIDWFRFSYTDVSGGFPPEGITASANGKFYSERTSGELVEATASYPNLVTDRQITAAQYLGKLYIQDHGPVRIELTDNSGVVTEAAGISTLDADSPTEVNDWDQYGIDTTGDVVELTNIVNGTGELDGTNPTVFQIIGVDATNGLRLGKYSDGSDITATCDDCDFRVVRGLKVFDSATNALTLHTPAANKGTPPPGCTIIAGYQSRLVFGGDPNNPGVFFATRANDPTDFDYGASGTDPDRAFASNSTNSDVGNLAVPIAAMAAYQDAGMAMSGASEFNRITGDPGYGGQNVVVSSVVGILDKLAWCYNPMGELYFLSRDGLYKYIPGTNEPIPVSREIMPSELLDITVQYHGTIASGSMAYSISLAYDAEYQGVYIYARETSETSDQIAWFFNERVGAFHRMTHDYDYQPGAVVYHPTRNRVILGGGDGYLREFSDDVGTDDGTTVSSYVDFGPFRMWDGLEGTLDMIEGVTDPGSASVSWSFRGGQSAQEAYNAAEVVTGSFSAGVNVRQAIRRTYEWGVIRLSATDIWAMERIRMWVRRRGAAKK